MLVSTTHEEATALSLSTNILVTTPNLRPAPKAFCVLLPVWGDAFITHFLAESLPTLLAEGNLPALARTLPTRFVFLTREGDENTIRAHRAYHHLRAVCQVEFLSI